MGFVVCSYLFGELCEQILVLQDLWVGVEGGEGEEKEGGQLGRDPCSGNPFLKSHHKRIWLSLFCMRSKALSPDFFLISLHFLFCSILNPICRQNIKSQDQKTLQKYCGSDGVKNRVFC